MRKENMKYPKRKRKKKEIKEPAGLFSSRQTKNRTRNTERKNDTVSLSQESVLVQEEREKRKVKEERDKKERTTAGRGQK